MAGTLPGFDPGVFRDAIHQVQEFFIPSAQRPLFHFPDSPATGSGLDSDQVPFNPAITVSRTPTKPPVSVPCSIRYGDDTGSLENLGRVVSSDVQINVLDVDYPAIEGFWYALIDGVRYYYRSTDLPSALGEVTVWNVRCQSEDES